MSQGGVVSVLMVDVLLGPGLCKSHLVEGEKESEEWVLWGLCGGVVGG